MLLQFMTEEDPMLTMLKWICEKLMEVEVDDKIHVTKCHLFQIPLNVSATHLQM